MAIYTYDAEADALQVQLLDESNMSIEQTVELGPNLHVDLDAVGRVIGVEFLYPRTHAWMWSWFENATGSTSRSPQLRGLELPCLDFRLERIGRDEAERPIGMKQVEKRSTIVRPAELRGGGLQYPSSIEG